MISRTNLYKWLYFANDILISVCSTLISLGMWLFIIFAMCGGSLSWTEQNPSMTLSLLPLIAVGIPCVFIGSFYVIYRNVNLFGMAVLDYIDAWIRQDWDESQK